jgi:hypothetical protein
MSLHNVELGHSFIDRMPDQAGSSAQRIRYGLTGLAIAFLIVLLGSVISRAGRDESANSTTQAASNEPSEPLAEIGVTPGGSDSDKNNSSNAVNNK